MSIQQISSEYFRSLTDVLDSSLVLLSDIKPSDWAETHRVMSSAESSFQGKFSYNITPYAREIVDCLSPDHPARVVSVMKGAQIGFSTGVIEAAIGWAIAENPANILFLTGHADLSEEAIAKIDGMIDGCGIRHLIKATAARARKSKTGDTNTKKEFAGGSLISGSAGNHRLLRQRSVRYAFIDDFDAAKSSTQESGATRKMIEQRLAAHYANMKLFYISTPEMRPSNIEESYLIGDQRRWNIPCQCCGTFIPLYWSVAIPDSKEMAGITWKLDQNEKLIPSSVGYVCQVCGGFFNDKNKYEFNLAGQWIPTAEPQRPGHYSYHISALYAPLGMYDWEYYVRDYIEANPIAQPRKEHLHQTFVNLCLGDTYEPTAEEIKATELQKNIRGYQIGLVPEKISQIDGNGRIVLLTLGCDLNGKVDDARLDYEIVAHSENGATYSILHGSIGTFVPREGMRGEDRERWTYEHGMAKSVWRELDKILDRIWETDTGRKMRIFISGIDCGYQTLHAYQYIDSSNFNVIGLKGKDIDKYTPIGRDAKTFRLSKEKNNLYLVEANLAKDFLAECMRLKWDENIAEVQPSGFMNYPTPSDGLYLFNNYFSHFEAEHRILDKNNTYRWLKKSDVHQNHLFDCRIYAMVCRDILVGMVCKELKIQNGTWADYCDVVMNRR